MLAVFVRPLQDLHCIIREPCNNVLWIPCLAFVHCHCMLKISPSVQSICSLYTHAPCMLTLLTTSQTVDHVQ